MVLFLVSGSLIAQKTGIRGTVYDEKTGEKILFGSVVVLGSNHGTSTDLDGTYSLELAPGTYSLECAYLGYNTLTISDIVVKAGQPTVLDIAISENTQTLQEVVVTASQMRNSEVSLQSLKRNTSAFMDGISSQNFKKIGDSDAAAAIKRVSGVSVEGGKYVFVRGLGDRYTKSILNSVDIPGLDPDRNTLQMDIFPTNILDNIIILKTFTADLPADFTGGVVNVSTKDFPDIKTMQINATAGYNPAMHFNSNYLTYEGGATDFLGFDDGTRAIPTDRRTDIPFRVNAITDPQGAGQEFRNILMGFNPTMGGFRKSSMMNYSLNFSTGNQIEKTNYKLGYNFSIAYKNDTEYFSDVEYNRYGIDNVKEITELDPREQQKGEVGTNNVLLGGLTGLSFKTQTSKISLNLLHLQSGESEAGLFNYENTDQGANFTAIQHNLEYSQRSLTNLMLTGSHNLKEGKWEVNWALSPTRSNIQDPDIRYTRYRTDNSGNLSIGTESGIPERIWRYLEEYNYAGNIHVNYNYKLWDRSSRLKFGVTQTNKMRDYEIQNFQIVPNQISITGNPNELFYTENLWSSENLSGVTYDPQFIPSNPNKFAATISTTGAYVSNEFQFTNRLKSVLGLRAEKYLQKYTGVNQDGDQFNDLEVLNNLDLFPSINFIYALSTQQNLRFSASKTIARPSFKEASYASIIDPITGRTFIGGFFPDVDVATGEQIWDGKLKKTDIYNLDLRWELYQERGQNISLSAFYKYFINPIEIVQYVQASNNFQPRNVGNGNVLGFEFEFLQSLGFLSSVLENISLNTNVTIVESSIEMSSTEFLARKRFARNGQEVDNMRNMGGQAPYLVNSGLSYRGKENGLELGLFYNVQGSTLLFVGLADRPDVYSVPFHSINFNANVFVGKDKRMNIGLKVDNILGDEREEVFRNFLASDAIFSSISPGRTFTLRLGYKLH
ncbi:MAG: TonB-dependent receptor [Saprospiraceae bacterium]|nr:TonB-dependent receptor [Saprospiraceae bacterium]